MHFQFFMDFANGFLTFDSDQTRAIYEWPD